MDLSLRSDDNYPTFLIHRGLHPFSGNRALGLSATAEKEVAHNDIKGRPLPHVYLASGFD